MSGAADKVICGDSGQVLQDKKRLPLFSQDSAEPSGFDFRRF
jgi:hypothetical protein